MCNIMYVVHTISVLDGIWDASGESPCQPWQSRGARTMDSLEPFRLVVGPVGGNHDHWNHIQQLHLSFTWHPKNVFKFCSKAADIRKSTSKNSLLALKYLSLENKLLLLISINFTPETSHSCLKLWYTMFSRSYLFNYLQISSACQDSPCRRPFRWKSWSVTRSPKLDHSTWRHDFPKLFKVLLSHDLFKLSRTAMPSWTIHLNLTWFRARTPLPSLTL